MSSVVVSHVYGKPPSASIELQPIARLHYFMMAKKHMASAVTFAAHHYSCRPAACGAFTAKQHYSKGNSPDFGAAGAACLGAGLVGLADRDANCEPTALSKKPVEAGFGDAGCLGAAFAGASDLVANWDPTAPSKKPFEVPAT